MLIDCETCVARDIACGECVVTVLLSAPPASGGEGLTELGTEERAAIAVLAGSGLVPPLRLAVGDVRRAGEGEVCRDTRA